MNQDVYQQLETLFSRYTKLSYRPREVLIRSLDKPRGIFFLTDGVVNMYHHTLDGYELNLNIFRAPCFFPLMWAIEGKDNPYTYEAKTKVTVWRAPRKEVIAVLANNPQIMFDLTSRLFRGLTGQLEEKSALMHGSSRTKVTQMLIILANRFGKKNHEAVELTLDISHPELAKLTGNSRETITRELGQLKKSGLIHNTSGHIIITNMDKLMESLEM